MIFKSLLFILITLRDHFWAKWEEPRNEEAVELLSRISPVACQHLNLGGLFEFNPAEDLIDIDAKIQQFADILRDALDTKT